MMNLFRKNNKKNTTARKDTRMVYAHVQWTDNCGRTAERMPKALLEQYVADGIIYEDYEIITYL